MEQSILFPRDYSHINQNSETFMFLASEPFEMVTASNSGTLITVSVDHLSCANQTYQMYGKSSNLIGTINTLNASSQIGTTIAIETMYDNYQYDISLSEDGLILYITIYTNMLTSAAVGINSTGDYITLVGLNPLNASVSEQPNGVCIDLPYTINNLGEVISNITGTKHINQVIIISGSDRTQIFLTLNESYIYYILESGNQYTLSFQAPGSQQPGSADNATIDPSDTSNTPAGSVSYGTKEIPTVSDIGRYEIVIPRPEGITASMVSDEDYYECNYFVIKLQGDYTNLINSSSITYESKVIDKISVSINSRNETVIKILTTKLQGYEIAWDEDNLYVNIGNPSDIYKNIVVLDPGHGGAAIGAHYYGTYEKDINFKILYTIGKNYFNSDTSKLKVYYTRTSDTDLALSGRAAFAKKVGADLFVSLHMNASETSSVSGTEIFYCNKNNLENPAGLTSKKLADIFLTNLTNTLGTTKRSVKEEEYTVIYKNTVPAILMELGFLSNKNEHTKLTDETFQNEAAKTIYETLLQVFEKYPTGR